MRRPLALLSCVLSTLVLVCGSASAQAATAYKTGERVVGQMKECYYRYASSDYVLTVASYELCPLQVPVSGQTTPAVPSQPQTVTALKVGEELTGATKQCYYEYGGRRYVLTILSYQICPYSAEVRPGGE